MADLRTDYKDDLLDTSVNTQRKYNVVNNDDGTVSFEDATVYTQNGDTFGASEVNQIHAAVNLVNDSLTVDTTNLRDDFSLNALLQMLAEKYFPNILYLFDSANPSVAMLKGYAVGGTENGATTRSEPSASVSGDKLRITAPNSNGVGTVFYDDEIASGSTITVNVSSINITNSNDYFKVLLCDSKADKYNIIGDCSKMFNIGASPTTVTFDLNSAFEVSTTGKVYFAIQCGTQNNSIARAYAEFANITIE